jgi:hypothetical protein
VGDVTRKSVPAEWDARGGGVGAVRGVRIVSAVNCVIL